MGGKILDYEAKDILNRGREEGEKQHLVNQVRKKLKRGKALEIIADELEETVQVIEEIIKDIQG